MTERQTVSSSCTDPPTGELPAAEALRGIIGAVRPIADTETLALWDADGRVLAEPIRSPLDVPGHTNSAVDGYAVRSADLAAQETAELAIVGRALAGHPYTGAVTPGTCVAITTGAPIPPNADSVVMQEHTEAVVDQVRFHRSCNAGDNVRQAGEDISRGSEVAPAGTRLNPALLGVLASLGLDRVCVRRRPRVAVFSTGDEVQMPGSALKPGSVYDSNRFALRGMLGEAGVELVDLGLVPDAPGELQARLEEATVTSDVIITSGGVSVGEADHIKPVLEALGHVDFWKLAIKPGRPLTFGRLGGTLFFGLPGNPVAVMVTFLQFVRPALQRLSGMATSPLTRLRAVCDTDLRKRPGRREFQRGIAKSDADGRLHVVPTGHQGSGILTSMSLANCLIVLPEPQEAVNAGDTVEIQLLPWASVDGPLA